MKSCDLRSSHLHGLFVLTVRVHRHDLGPMRSHDCAMPSGPVPATNDYLMEAYAINTGESSEVKTYHRS